MNPILASFVPTAKLIASTFGKNCEVVIHDLTMPENSVVFAINAHVTNRKVGQSFDHLFTRVLNSEQFDGDCLCNYYFISNDNKKIKSSTALIRNERSKVIGALCVNYDTDYLANVHTALEEFLSGIETAQPSMQNEESQSEDIMSIAEEIIDRVIEKYDVDAMQREDKIKVVRFLHQKGIFLVKGSIDIVAQRLSISRVTVYSYLDEIKKDIL